MPQVLRRAAYLLSRVRPFLSSRKSLTVEKPGWKTSALAHWGRLARGGDRARRIGTGEGVQLHPVCVLTPFTHLTPFFLPPVISALREVER